MKNIIVFLADGFEECEALVTVDILRRAGFKVTTASIMGRGSVIGAHNVTVLADVLAEEADFDAADMIILPGGGVGTQNLSGSDIVRRECLKFASDKQVAAICAAPTVLAGLGILEGRNATCYPGMEYMMKGAVTDGSMVVTDRNVITGKGPGAAVPFALEIVKYFEGERKAEEIAGEFVAIRV